MQVAKTAFFLLFFCSGLATLGHEIAWARFYVTAFGHELPATFAVVCAYFTGMAGGAFLSERLLARHHAATLYASLEGIIGVWAIFSVFLIPQSTQLGQYLLPLNAAPSWHWLLVFAIATVTLLPATLAIGALLPVMDRFLQLTAGHGRSFGAIYGAHTFGAALGVLLVTGSLVRLLGLSLSVLCLAGINLGCAIFILVLARTKTAPAPAAVSHTRILLLALQAGLIGLFGMLVELNSTRWLAQITENTVYSFAATLVAYIASSAAGGFAYHYLPSSFRTRALLHSLAAAAALSLLASACLVLAARPLLQWFSTLLPDSVTRQWFAEGLVACLIVFPPAAISGAIFVHLVEAGKQAGQSPARLVAANLTGAALAPVALAVFLPLLGSKAFFTAILLLPFFMALPRCLPQAALPGFCLALVLLLPFPLPPAPLLRGHTLLARSEGPLATAAVIETPDGERLLRVNGRFQMGGTAAALLEQRQAHVPLLLHPQPERALFLGLGTGITFGTARFYPGLQADGVELLSEVLALLPYFASHNGWPYPPDMQTSQADARRFLKNTTRRYDVIVGDLFHPARDGAATLYAVEQFQAMRDRLQPGGIVCQWLPLHQLNPDSLRTILRTFLTVFPETHAYLLRPDLDLPILGLISTAGGRLPVPSPDGSQPPALLPQLVAQRLQDPVHLLGGFLAGPDWLSQCAQNAPLTTDDSPSLAYLAPEQAYSHATAATSTLQWLLAQSPGAQSISALLAPAADPALLAKAEAFSQARNAYLLGWIAEQKEDHSQAIHHYLRSVSASTEFTLGYSRAIQLALYLHQSGSTTRAQALLAELSARRPDIPLAQQLLDRL